MYTSKQLMRMNPQHVLQEFLKLQEELNNIEEGRSPDEIAERPVVSVEDKEQSIKVSQARKKQRQEEHEINKNQRKLFARQTVEIAEEFGLRFLHIRPFTKEARGGITVAYGLYPDSNKVAFSISTCSKKDIYDKKLGAYHAALEFKSGNTSSLLNTTKMPAGAFLYHVFSRALSI